MKRWIGFAALLALVLACSKDQIETEPEARLKSITVSATTLILPVEGNVELPFTVRDPGFVFNYSVSSPDCQISLVGPDGKAPKYFHLSGVIKGEEPGHYTAIIQDDNIDATYIEDALLTLALVNPETGNRSYINSTTFSVRSEGADTGGVIIRTGLPVVYVNTENGAGIWSKEEYVKASLMIKGNSKYDGLGATSCQIRGRGNTTWIWPKKPYLIKLDEKEHIFGMHKHKRWVLLANFLDRTLMRNIISMKVSSLTRLAWTPGCVPVELVLNGEHMGNYLLIEQVRVDNHRVDITEMTPQDNSGDAVTGGYLLELDFHYDNKFQWKDHDIPFAVKYPDPDELTPAQKTYIKNYIAEVSNALYGSNFTDPEKGYAKYLDVDSFVDYWIVFEVMGNHELGNPGSVFFHKDRKGKLVAGPCWDFDWGVLSYNTSPHAKTGLVNGKAIWYRQLFKDPAFKQKVKDRFNELLPMLQTIPAYIDETQALLRKSAELNFKMWNPAEDASQNGGNIINGDENLSFDEAVARLRSIYQERLTVIPKNL